MNYIFPKICHEILQFSSSIKYNYIQRQESFIYLFIAFIYLIVIVHAGSYFDCVGPGYQTQLSGLMVNTFTRWAISPAPTTSELNR